MKHVILQKSSSKRRLSENRTSQSIKEYKFSDFEHMRRFVDSILELQQHTYHDMGVYLHYPHVKVSSITRGINEATDLDIEYLQEIDCLYEDSK